MAIKQSNDRFCCHLLPVCPYKWGSLPRQGHQGLSQICKIFNKSAIISDKANKLSDTFDLSGTCQFCTAANFTGSHSNPVRPTICSKKTTSVCMKIYLLALRLASGDMEPADIHLRGPLWKTTVGFPINVMNRRSGARNKRPSSSGHSVYDNLHKTVLFRLS